jgi:hypothetical protein
MISLSPSSAIALRDHAVAGDDARGRWWRSIAERLPRAAGLALILALVQFLGGVLDEARGFDLVLVSVLGPLVTTSLLLMFVAIVDALRPPAHLRSPVLLLAAVFAAGLGTLIDTVTLVRMQVWASPPWSVAVMWWFNFGWMIPLYVGATFIDDFRTRAKRRAASLRGLRLEHARKVRRTVEARLQAMQARVDPQFLFDALAATERIYESDAAAGDRLLEDLIGYLRAALPDLRGTASTLGKEADLARAWLDIQRVVVGDRLQYEIGAADDVRAARFPPMMIVPIMEGMIKAARDGPRMVALTLRAHREASRISLRVACSSVASDADLEAAASMRELRARLHELYGGAGRLMLTIDEAHAEAVLEIPDDSAKSGDR